MTHERTGKSIRRWAAMSICLWLLSAAFFFALIAMYFVYVHPAIVETARNGGAEVANQVDILRALSVGLVGLMAWSVLLFLAGGGTIAFILASRRETLREMRSTIPAQ